MVQIRSYGAVLKTIPGSREETAKAVLSAARTGYYASHSWNPFFFHGTKTFAYEVWEQLGWKEPDTVILPVGNGTLLLGAYLGFGELLDAGMIRGVPKIVGVQSASCAPLVKAFRQGSGKIPAILPRETVAEGIAIATPVRGEQIVTAVKKSGGGFLAVDEEEIEKSLRWACERGFYVEPTSAAAVAAVFKYLETSDPEEIIVSTLTGHGLKATEKILKILQDTH